MDEAKHGQIMEIFRFFGPILSIAVIALFLIGMWIYFVKRKGQSFDAAAKETEGEMTGKDGFNLLMDLRIQSQNLVRDHENFQKNLKNFEEQWGKKFDKLEERQNKDHDKLIRLETKIDETK
jgi:uncharacterized membrane protein